METTTTTGTGAITLAGAVLGFRAFTSVLANADKMYYVIQAVDANGIPTGDYEVGKGIWTTSGTSVTRSTVIVSSNANSQVNFAAGTKRVWIPFTAQQLTSFSPAQADSYPGCVPNPGTTTHTPPYVLGDDAAWHKPNAAASDQTTATSNALFVTPGVQQNHPSASKAWVSFHWNGSSVVIDGSYNISSVARQSKGVYRITFSTAFADTGYGVGVMGGFNTTVTAVLFLLCHDTAFARTTTQFQFAAVDFTGTTDDGTNNTGAFTLLFSGNQ